MRERDSLKPTSPHAYALAALNCVVVEQRETMFQMVMLIIKWVSFPALVIASMFSCSATSHGLLLDFVICLGAPASRRA